MRTIRRRQVLAALTAAAILASLSVATVATPASAAKPKCQGRTATIVGSARGEIIRGTARRDIIVARGGADRIYGRGGNDLICAGTGNDIVHGGPGADTVWGQLGHDRLNGNAGNDFLAGQVGNDTINGGINVDTCYQGTGSGAVTYCELPAVAPPPPPPPPTLVVAYTDVNTNHVYDTGDVMIAEIVDTNGSGMVDPGDTILMGQYPTTPHAVRPATIRQTMEPWGVRSHPVTSADLFPAIPNATSVQSGATHEFGWQRIGAASPVDAFAESGPGELSRIFDESGVVADGDWVSYKADSPSKPIETWLQTGDSTGDAGFIDVEIYAP